MSISGGSRGRSRVPPPSPPHLHLFLDQTEARRAEINFFGDRLPPPYLRVWMTGPPVPLSQGLDPPLQIIHILRYRKMAVNIKDLYWNPGSRFKKMKILASSSNAFTARGFRQEPRTVRTHLHQVSGSEEE